MYSSTYLAVSSYANRIWQNEPPIPLRPCTYGGAARFEGVLLNPMVFVYGGAGVVVGNT